MSKENVVCRFLKSRAEIDKNAGALAMLIEADRGIDAVELDMNKMDSQKQILAVSDLSYCLLNINNHLILLYPGDEREKYMNIKDELQFNGQIMKYSGVTYAEADSIKDFLMQAGVKYKIHSDSDRHIHFLISKEDSKVMDRAVNAVRKEIESEPGKKYLMGKNLCWANAITQVSKALSGSEPSYIGTEGGTNGISINEDGAVVMRTQGNGEFISKLDPNFKQKVQDIVINEFKGGTTPIKAIYGDYAKEITYGMSQYDIRKKAMTKNEAMNELNLNSFPSIESLSKMTEQDLEGKKKEALYALIRMSLCRSIKLEGFDELKMSKSEKIAYENMHQSNLNGFKKRDIDIHIGHESGGMRQSER